MKKSSVKKLVAIYDAIGGMVSEIPDTFDSYYAGGTDKMLADFETVLEECGVKFAKCEKGVYYVVPYMGFTGKDWEKLGVKPAKRWGICTDKDCPNASWVLTGMGTPEEAIETIRNPKVFGEDSDARVEVVETMAD